MVLKKLLMNVFHRKIMRCIILGTLILFHKPTNESICVCFYAVLDYSDDICCVVFLCTLPFIAAIMLLLVKTCLVSLSVN